MRRHHRRKIPHRVWPENQSHRINHGNRENQHKIWRNDMCAALADIRVTTTKRHLGCSPNTLRFFCIKLFILLRYSISNYPLNYNDHINPPPRFSDTTGLNPESTNSIANSSNIIKKSGNSPRIRTNQKMHREAFQINV